MKQFGMTLNEALSYVQNSRQIAKPNSYFMMELEKYEKELNVKF
jgi:hypothetical protein